MQDTSGWKRVMFTAECDPDGEGWCQIKNCDVSACPCYGPTQDGLEYTTINDVLFARPVDPAARDGAIIKALEAVLPFVGFVPLDATRRAQMNDAVSFALKALEYHYQED
jgi:hypothetical protein